jgi:ketol-acid reductoisomerase
LGYGSQGHAQAQNLRDSGCRVVVAELPGTPGHERAVRDGFEPVSAARATAAGDLVALLLPDQRQAEVFCRDIRPNLRPGKVLVAAHGLNLYFRRIEMPDGVAAVLVAPNGPGSLVRAEYLLGRGVPCLVAVAGDAEGRVGQANRDSGGASVAATRVATPQSTEPRLIGLHGPTKGSRDLDPPYGESAPPALLSLALAYAKAIGCTRAGAIESTLEEETVTDLFGEQVVLCGGLGALIQAAFETLVEAGYQAEVAYLVCVQELKQIVDLVYQGGLSRMRQIISDTAEYGDYTRGPRIITPETKAEMKRILDEVRDGRFAREWFAEAQSGGRTFEALRAQHQAHPIEEAGRGARKLIPWLDHEG